MVADFYAENPDNPRFTHLVHKARHTNRARDADERAMGFATPDSTPFQLLRTALMAVSAGLACEDWDAVAEGFVMLQHLERAIRSTEPVRGTEETDVRD